MVFIGFTDKIKLRLAGDSNNSDGGSDDLLSQLLDLDDSPSEKKDSSKSEAEGFGAKTQVDGDDKTEVLIKPSNPDQTELLVKEEPDSAASDSESAKAKEDQPQSLDDFLGLTDSGVDSNSSDVNESEPSKADADDLIGQALEEADEATEFLLDDSSSGAASDSSDEATELGDIPSSVDEATVLEPEASAGESNAIDEALLSAGEDAGGQTIVLDNEIPPETESEPDQNEEADLLSQFEDVAEEAPSGQAPSDDESQAQEELDPIDAALAEYASSQEQEGAEGLGLDANAQGAAQKTDAGGIDELLSEEAEPQQVDAEPAQQKELSAEDFADVFQSGPIQVPQEPSPAKKVLKGKAKKIIGIAAGTIVLLGVVGFLAARFWSEAGILGYRMDGLSFERTYQKPDVETQAEFARIFKSLDEAIQADNPDAIKEALPALDTVLEKDVRNFEAATRKLEAYGILMAWEGVQGSYPAAYDASMQQANVIAQKIKEALNWDRLNRAKAWRSVAAGEYVNSFKVLESALKGQSPENLALLAELAFRSGNAAKAEEYFKKADAQKFKRVAFFKALSESDNDRLGALAKGDYLPARVELLVSERINSEGTRTYISQLNRLFSKVKAYPWLAVQIQARRGDVYVLNGEEEKAQKEWKAILERSPNESEVWFKLAKSYERDSNWDKALDSYQQAIKTGGIKKRVALRYISLLRTRLKVVDALDVLEKALAQYPDDPDFYYQKGQTQISIYQEDAARASFEKALEKSPGYEPATLALARLNTKHQEFEAAEDLYKKIPSSSKNYASALIGLGELSRARHDLKQAQKYFALAHKNDPKNVKAYEYLTELLLRKESEAKAQALVSKGLKLLPKSVDLKIIQSKVIAAQGRPDEALKIIKPYLKSHNHLLELSFAHVEILIEKKEYFEARSVLKALAAQEISDPELSYYTALAYLEGEDDHRSVIGSDENAWREIQEAVRKKPDEEKYLLLYAKAALAVDERVEANEAIEKVIRLYPDSYPAYTLRADLSVINGYPERAIQDYERALKLTKHKGDIYKKLAQLYSGRGQAAKALGYYQKTARAFPQDARTFLELGKLYNEMGRYQRAIANLKRAIRLDSELADAYYYLGFIQKEIGDTSTAVNNFERYLRLDPNGVEAATVRDEIYFLRSSQQN